MEASPREMNLTSHSSEPSDLTLMSQIQADDESALDVLMQRYWLQLVAYAVSIVGTVDPAEDVVQEAFVRLWQHRKAWTPTGTVRAYLHTVVRNLGLHERERRAIRTAWSQRERKRQHHSPTPLELLEEHEVLLALEDAIQDLPQRRREIFTLACLCGLSYREVADTLQIAVPTVANQMSAALNSLREALAPVSEERF
ncbi:MAG: sigma-70 family RNA polymerase sigma factor [Gemmatimonas sp.]|nr:sigma-70 family RNA polymerase sigma factor [Gemmatimonas sp.]